MADFFERNLVVVYFFYGLAFFSMGLAIWLASARFRTSELRLAGPLLFLAGFGVVHGLQEWHEMFHLLEMRGGSNIPGWLLLPASAAGIAAVVFAARGLGAASVRPGLF